MVSLLPSSAACSLALCFHHKQACSPVALHCKFVNLDYTATDGFVIVSTIPNRVRRVIYQLVYVSRATSELSVDELDSILATARRNNSTQDITGMLLHHDGSFIQVLEGQQDAVDQLYATISEDPRHENAYVVLRAEVEERAFDEWSMGYKRASTLDEVPEGFHHFLQTGYRRQRDVDNEAARKALLAFKEGRWRA